MQKTAKDEALKTQSRPVFGGCLIGLELYPFIWGFSVNFRVAKKQNRPKFIDFRRFNTYQRFCWLSDQDSNLDRQNQNLQCYRYTIGQRVLRRCKVTQKTVSTNYLFFFGFDFCFSSSINPSAVMMLGLPTSALSLQYWYC
jgi:hypothetical protein